MKENKRYSLTIIFGCLSVIGYSPAIAQIIPDQSLNTLVTDGNDSIVRVSGGSQAGKNLFHSFDQLNVNADQQLLFENSGSTQNIFSRVTGSSVSSLNGLISTLNPSNVYILNLNGIVFGESISLNIGGSFLASTASSIQFNDGINFTSVLGRGKQAISLSELQLIRFFGDSGSITLNGTGNQINVDPITRIGIGAGLSTNGIRVDLSQGIVLLGDGIQLDGGTVTAPSGTISLGSVKIGDISFSGFQAQPTALTDYTKVDAFGDISLKDAALLDASGPFGGFINLNGGNLTLENSSYILIQNVQGPGGGLISLNFQDSITFMGVNDRPALPSLISPLRNSSGIYSSSVFSVGADIDLKAKNLSLIDAGVVFNHVALGGVGGNTNVDVSDSILIKGDVLPVPNITFSSIFVGSNGDGAAGNIRVRGSDISLQNHGTIQSAAASSVDSGSIIVTADNSLMLFGSSPVSKLGSTIESDSFRSGTAASISVKAKTLQVFDGAIVGSAALASGDTGDVTIDVADSIRLSESAIGTIATADSLSNQEQFGLPPIPSGNVGNTRVRANNLVIENGSLLSASNEGLGQTGDLIIDVNQLQVRQADISSFALSDNGGNIVINSNFLQLNDSSTVSVNSLGSGDGGNIAVDSDFVILDNESSIVANSADARGGNVSINTTGLFLSPDSQITASSSLGESFSGTIDITTPNLDLQRGSTVIDDSSESTSVATVCNSTGRENELTFAGTGGIPSSVDDLTSRRLKYYAQGKISGEPLIFTDPITGKKEKIERAVGWKLSEGGKKFSLVADAEQSVQYQAAKTACLKSQQPV
jgi:filamentous hemagglutinin family protein